MSKAADAETFHKLVNNIVRGGALTPAGIFGPFGVDRGLREELLKKAGPIAGKIKSGRLEATEVSDFLALCGVAEANGVLSESDYDSLNNILDRNR